MLGTIYDILVCLCAVAISVVTALPLSRSRRWWIRSLDFPRVQFATAAFLVMVLGWWVDRPLGWAVMAFCAVCVVYQSIRILPYTPLWPKEIRLASQTGGTITQTMLSSNVEMTNDRHGDVARLIDEVDPDILFLMETDDAWNEALAPQLARYPHVVRELRDDFWGMIFATRLPVERAEAIYLTHDDTPTLFAELRCKEGRPFRFVGLHPQPPVPGVDTEDRDAEILYAARFAHAADIPLIAMGDFNDAAWSDSTHMFKRVGEFLDPRVGRGMFASFDARSRLLRVPIDQFFITKEVAIQKFRRGPDIGSDHFPMIATISTDPDLAARLNTAPPAMKETDREGIEEAMERYRRSIGRDPLAGTPKKPV